MTLAGRENSGLRRLTLRQRCRRAFTIIELIAVIGIMALIAALVGPSLTHFRKGDAMLAATRQMIDSIHYARQLAISQRTTVYMVFVPTNFWSDPLRAGGSSAYNGFSPAQFLVGSNLLDKQVTGYNFVTLRTVGDQPGAGIPHYLSTWKALPESSFIAEWKFALGPNQSVIVRDPASGATYPVYGFQVTNGIPFPTEDTAKWPAVPTGAYVTLPYLAFDSQGRLVSERDPAGNYRDAYIPLAHGSVLPAMDGATKVLVQGPISISETPPFNSTNSFNLIHIDWLTGRARLEHREVQ